MRTWLAILLVALWASTAAAQYGKVDDKDGAATTGLERDVRGTLKAYDLKIGGTGGTSHFLRQSSAAGSVTSGAVTVSKTWLFIDWNGTAIPTKTVPSIYANRGDTFTITEVCCEVDSGTTTINLQRDDGTLTDMIDVTPGGGIDNLTCNVAINSGCTSNFVSGENVIAGNNQIDFKLVSNSAASRITLTIKYVLP